MEDLNEAILLNRDALALRPPGHPGRSASLGNLAVDLSTRFKQLGEMEDLNEAIVLNREALALCPPGHPDRSASLGNLASHLSSRYNQLGAMENLNETISLARDALEEPGRTSRVESVAHNEDGGGELLEVFVPSFPLGLSPYDRVGRRAVEFARSWVRLQRG